MKKHYPRKRFGQHFLHDHQVVARIVSAISPICGEALVEIGPGKGILTEPIANCCKQLTVIEIDRDLAQHLQHHSPVAKYLKVYQQDVMKTDFAALYQSVTKPLRVFGNLPYNISTPLLFRLFDYITCIQDMHFMLQQEVVERILARPNDKTYGKLSVMVQYFCHVEPILAVASTAFWPVPKVNSAVVRLIPNEQPYEASIFFGLAKVCGIAFGQRRKTLRNSLSRLFSTNELISLDIDPNLRAENVTLNQYKRLAGLVVK